MPKNINLHLKYIQPSINCLFDDQVQVVVNRVYEQLTLKNKPQKKISDGILYTTQTVIEGLYQLYGSRYENCRLSVPSSEHSYGNKPNLIHNHRYIVVQRVVEALLSLGWIERKIGIKNKYGEAIPTSIRPTGELLKAFETTGYRWRKLLPIQDDVIVLKGYDEATKSKYSLTFSDDNQTTQWRGNLQSYNQFASNQAVCLSLDNGHLELLIHRMANNSYQLNFVSGVSPKARGRVFNFLQVQLRRIFARGSFAMGGRFYGGWWQFIPSEYRRYITINGLPTVEVDYSELHPRLMYLQAGLPIPEGDLYDLGLRYDENPYDRTVEPYKSKRKVIKTYINAIINDDRGHFRLNSEQIKALGMKTSQLEELVFKKHPLLKEIKGKGYGLRFQFIDSQIAEKVMLTLLKQEILCLPVHDSFICQERHLHALTDAMNEAYLEILGALPSLKSPEVFKTDFELALYPNGQPDITYMRNQYKGAAHDIFLSGYFSSQSEKRVEVEDV